MVASCCRCSPHFCRRRVAGAARCLADCAPCGDCMPCLHIIVMYGARAIYCLCCGSPSQINVCAEGFLPRVIRVRWAACAASAPRFLAPLPRALARVSPGEAQAPCACFGGPQQLSTYGGSLCWVSTPLKRLGGPCASGLALLSSVLLHVARWPLAPNRLLLVWTHPRRRPVLAQ